ncbi:hypothetical protein Dsin_028323 [Dipteronia sinensis]|uniref:DUF4283 domain-containing protein n=1 Tax=Dipteronia sinensis TaxID=43782 RepID=A0AAD9ZQM7_9ROSI|nr:hypothetical protein Dsin_028323 [Dipteronia sinensis]
MAFSDVVKGQDQKKEEKDGRMDEICKRIIWEEHPRSIDWISKRVIGTLRKFTSFSNVGSRLANREFAFSTSYFSDKSILWTFQSEHDAAEFCRNQFLWDDCFSSMERGSPKDASYSRLVWVELEGVHLSSWSESFFLKMGGVLGEALLVDDHTTKKRRFDKGRVLVAVPHGRICPNKIKVDVEGKIFMVGAEVVSSPVDYQWVEQQLGIHTAVPLSNSNSCSVREKDGASFEKSMICIGQRIAKCDGMGGRKVRKVSEKVSDKHQVDRLLHSLRYDKGKGAKRDVNSGCLGHQGQKIMGTVDRKEEKDKGKNIYQRKKTNIPTTQQNRTAMIILEKRRKHVENGGSEGDDSSSSSESERGWWQHMVTGVSNGECSKKVMAGPKEAEGLSSLEQGKRAYSGSYAWAQYEIC